MSGTYRVDKVQARYVCLRKMCTRKSVRLRHDVTDECPPSRHRKLSTMMMLVMTRQRRVDCAAALKLHYIIIIRAAPSTVCIAIFSYGSNGLAE